MFTFRGDRIAWFAGMGPDHGYADVYLDDVLEETVDAYAAEPSDNQLVFERAGLKDAVHSVRIVVRRERHPLATGCIQSVDGFDAEEAVHYPSHLRALAMEELRSVAGGTQSWTPPETFNPIVRRRVRARDGRDGDRRMVPRRARSQYRVPEPDVRRSTARPLGRRSSGRVGGSAARRAAQTLRWEERADMRRIVDLVVGDVVARQRPDGYCLPYDESSLRVDAYIGEAEPYNDERRNYDRVGLTRGLVAAGKAGHPDAYPVLRRLGLDWYNASSLCPRGRSRRPRRLGQQRQQRARRRPGGLFLADRKARRSIDGLCRAHIHTALLHGRDAPARAAGDGSLSAPCRPQLPAAGLPVLARSLSSDGEREYLDAALGAGTSSTTSTSTSVGRWPSARRRPARSPGHRLTRHTGEACGSASGSTSTTICSSTTPTPSGMRQRSNGRSTTS